MFGRVFLVGLTVRYSNKVAIMMATVPGQATARVGGDARMQRAVCFRRLRGHPGLTFDASTCARPAVILPRRSLKQANREGAGVLVSFCPECGEARRPGATMCDACGHEFAPTCPNCGTSTEPGARLCPSCGEELPANQAITDGRSAEFSPSSQPPQRAEVWLRAGLVALCAVLALAAWFGVLRLR